MKAIGFALAALGVAGLVVAAAWALVEAWLWHPLPALALTSGLLLFVGGLLYKRQEL